MPDLPEAEVAPEQPWGNTYPVSGDDYYWRDDAETLARKLAQKIVQWRTEKEPLDSRARLNWFAYYSLDGGRASWSDNLYLDGEMGERVRLRVGMARELIQHILVNTCSVEPSLDPLPQNTDQQSTKQVNVARSIAYDVMDNKGGYETANKATEYAEVLDFSAVEGEWDELDGGIFAADDGQSPVYRGDVKYNVLGPGDIFFDLAKTDHDHDYLGTRKWRNKFNLIAASDPALKDEIMRAPRKMFSEDTRINELPNPIRFETADTELVEVFTFYHRKCAALPMGRRITLLSTGQYLEDGPLPYDKIPVWWLFPSEVIGTSVGFGPMTALGSTQEAFNKMVSTVATTLYTHGISNVIVDSTANLDAQELGGGQRVFEVSNPTHAPLNSLIAPLQLTALPPEVFEFIKALEGFSEQGTGLNKIVRGDPGGVTAGVALSLYQAMAQQFQGPLEKNRAKLIKSMVLWAWEAYRTHAPNMPRLVQLVGKSNREALQTFLGSHLEGMDRLDVTQGNPLTRTPAGKIQMVQMLKQDGMPLPPQVIAEVMNTGNIEAALGSDADEADLVRAENEMLSEGLEPKVLLGQDDGLHIFHHSEVGFSTNISPQAQSALERHLQAHLQKMGQGDMILMARRGLIHQGFANPMFAPPPEAPPGGGGGPPAGPKGKPPPKKPEGLPGSPPPNPTAPAPLPGPSPQQ